MNPIIVIVNWVESCWFLQAHSAYACIHDLDLVGAAPDLSLQVNSVVEAYQIDIGLVLKERHLSVV